MSSMLMHSCTFRAGGDANIATTVRHVRRYFDVESRQGDYIDFALRVTRRERKRERERESRLRVRWNEKSAGLTSQEHRRNYSV